MILFVFEGKGTEIKIFNTLKAIYPNKFSADSVICTFCGNLFMLCSEKDKLEENFKDSADIVFLLQEHIRNNSKDIPDEYKELLKIENSDEISEIYFFFDLDLHVNNSIDLKDKLEIVERLTKCFCDEDTIGKIYISYPMVESFKYLKCSSDTTFLDATFPVENASSSFKEKSADYCYDKSLKDFLCKSSHNEARKDMVWSVWNFLAEENARKVNFLCNGVSNIPSKSDTFSPFQIFEQQKNKYIKNGVISVLSGFALFVFEF